MYRLLIMLLAFLFLAAPGWAQQSDEDAEATEESEAIPEEEEQPEFDESGLDEQGFEDQDDDFRPTEEIPTDQSIEFPTDI